MGSELINRPTDWILIICIVAGTLLVLAHYFHPERVKSLLSFPWQNTGDEFSLSFNSGSNLLGVDRVLIIGAWMLFPVLIVALKMRGQPTAILNYDWASYFGILLLAGLYLVLKLLVASAVGYIFDRQEELLKGQNMALAYFCWISFTGGIVSFVFYFLSFLVWPYYLTLAIVLVLLILFVARSAQYTLKLGFHSSYIIVYICALEIIPLSFLYTLV